MQKGDFASPFYIKILYFVLILAVLHQNRGYYRVVKISKKCKTSKKKDYEFLLIKIKMLSLCITSVLIVTSLGGTS